MARRVETCRACRIARRDTLVTTRSTRSRRHTCRGVTSQVEVWLMALMAAHMRQKPALNARQTPLKFFRGGRENVYAAVKTVTQIQ